MRRTEWRGDVIGMVLGDGSLYRQRLPDGSWRGNAKLSISHSPKQLDYLVHKRDVIQPIFNYEIPIHERLVRHKATGKTYPAYSFTTRSHPRLEFIRQRIYVSSGWGSPTRSITDWALKNITLQGLAYWWMDDGHFHRRMSERTARSYEATGYRKHGLQMHFINPCFVMIAHWAMNGFPEEDVAKVRDWIEARYGVRFHLAKHVKKGLSLRLGGIKAKPFLDRLAEYAHLSMAYKFWMPSDSARQLPSS